MKTKIILASASKRRSAILTECGIPHDIAVSHVEELHDEKKGAPFNARINARRKAYAIASRYRNGYIIGADTLVSLGKRLIGKPKSKHEARRLLKQFSGKTISVYTGIIVIDAKKKKSAAAVVHSKVRVKKISPNLFDTLLKALGPHDKAGGFSIEGVGTFIFDNVEGSFYNILGLPTIKLFDLFKELGVNLLDYTH